MEDYIEDNKIFSRSMFRRSETLNERRSTTVNDSTNRASTELGMITLKSNVRVTFHQRELMMETFKEYFNDYEVLERSLSPDANRE